LNALALFGEHAKQGEALHSDVNALSTLHETQILIERLSTDTKIPGYLCFLLTFRYAEFHLGNLFAFAGGFIFVRDNGHSFS
jgi:hypothetical protein